MSGQLEHCPLKRFVAAGTLPDAEIVELGKIEREQGDRFGNIGEDDVADGGDILMFAAPVEIELDQAIGHQVAERLAGEMDATRGGDQAVGQIPLQLGANAGKPARKQQELVAEGLLEGMAVGGPNLEGRGYALELLDEMGAVEERLCAEMAQFEIALQELAEVGGVAFVASGTRIEQIAEGRSE